MKEKIKTPIMRGDVVKNLEDGTLGLVTTLLPDGGASVLEEDGSNTPIGAEYLTRIDNQEDYVAFGITPLMMREAPLIMAHKLAVKEQQYKALLKHASDKTKHLDEYRMVAEGYWGKYWEKYWHGAWDGEYAEMTYRVANNLVTGAEALWTTQYLIDLLDGGSLDDEDEQEVGDWYDNLTQS